MHLSKSDIFWKCWWWSLVCGAALGMVFYALTSFIPLFRWPYGGATFINLLITLSIAGSYFGAGYIGWRIADKYYGNPDNRFTIYYIRYSLITFVILVAVTYSPLSFLGLLWSLVAPASALIALGKVRPAELKHPKRTSRTTRRVVTR